MHKATEDTGKQLIAPAALIPQTIWTR